MKAKPKMTLVVLQMPVALHRALKLHAVGKGVSMRAVIEAALKKAGIK